MDSGVTRPVAIGIGLAVVLAIGMLAVWGLTPGETRKTPPGLSEVADPQGIQEIVQIDKVGILTSTNYLGHKIYVVRGTLKNISAKALRLIEVKMTFVDYSNKQIFEEVHSAFEPKQRPLEPGTEYRFEVNFENLPRSWNYRVPKTEVVKVAY